MFKRSFHRDAVFVMALYNVVAGAVFFLLYKRVFQLFEITRYTPAHPPAIQIPCLFLVIFGLGYLWASRDLVRNRALVFVGLLQNAGVAGMAVWYRFDRPELVHDVYLLPAGISALFAIMFFVAWVGAIVDARRERRRGKLMLVKRVPKRAEAPATPKPEPEAPAAARPGELAGEPAPDQIEEVPEPREPEAPIEPSPPEGQPPPRSQAEDDQSDVPNDRLPPTPLA